MLSDHSFAAVTELFHSASGIRLQQSKRGLVIGRLQQLARTQGIADLDAYVHGVLRSPDDSERVRLIDKLTTNETYFFREPEHYALLERIAMAHAQSGGGATLRVWSAASSSGEEAYSIAMVLADRLGLAGWEVVGTDLSTAVVETAQQGLYPLERARMVPPDWLKRWCLKGQGEHEGKLLVARQLRERVHFMTGNLRQPLPDIGQFDVIFLRNVLIYFDDDGKTDIVLRALDHLAPDGRLLTGHAESISSLPVPVQAIGSAVYAHAS